MGDACVVRKGEGARHLEAHARHLARGEGAAAAATAAAAAAAAAATGVQPPVQRAPCQQLLHQGHTPVCVVAHAVNGYNVGVLEVRQNQHLPFKGLSGSGPHLRGVGLQALYRNGGPVPQCATHHAKTALTKQPHRGSVDDEGRLGDYVEASHRGTLLMENLYTEDLPK